MPAQPALADRLHQGVFDALYARSLVYNTCWEDPAVDRQALAIGADDRLLVITSAGCNVLDYALCAPARIHAVDANPRQTALLELKLAGIRRLDFADFFALFGEGRHRHATELYRDALRDALSPFAAHYWDRRIAWFGQRRDADSFFYCGLAGLVARGFRAWLRAQPRLRGAVEALFEAHDLDAQRARYDAEVAPRLWGRTLTWAIAQPLTMSLLGVPHPQREEVARQHAGGIAGFVRASIDYVFRELPVADNYFWSVYVRGRYTRECCPEYLKRANFERLKGGLAARVVAHTDTVTGFLRGTSERISRFVLLDHMDWMSVYHPQALADEWAAIFARATPDARLIFRSAHAAADYLEHIRVPGAGRLPERLDFDRALAARLQLQDRVHTYAGFHIARLRA
ncbi:S-adenosylmethionine-diacylglycerol 3-amino-3-carboxypropyl transferase [Plasticicumulans lactativorans]|uniref:S-adenosylmethionine-diacylglycerol 3-amino-3-carboxypropyl transferase n=1 Tax=Plasticicumulans lactativorans TaxID=1133106 RepID=A0A4R2L932_9GAMM|nr:BtaA family protein [Plasticicumulans lactativorans]TCO79248.1 S-adenosylmethionine-diacylglycerol 3-amino-3-carboxypropyl transferase [Plasticicumulans lactativorans]